MHLDGNRDKTSSLPSLLLLNLGDKLVSDLAAVFTVCLSMLRRVFSSFFSCVSAGRFSWARKCFLVKEPCNRITLHMCFGLENQSVCVCCVGCCRNFTAVRLHTHTHRNAAYLHVGLKRLEWACKVRVCSFLQVDFFFLACMQEHVCKCLCLPMPCGRCTRSFEIWGLQSNASCYSRAPGELCRAVTEQLRGGDCWRAGDEISCVAHAARGEHQCQALGYSSVWWLGTQGCTFTSSNDFCLHVQRPTVFVSDQSVNCFLHFHVNNNHFFLIS